MRNTSIRTPGFSMTSSNFHSLSEFQRSNCVNPYTSLIYSLKPNAQIIWDEIGESDADRDKMLQELEQECLEVYRRKVDKSNQSRARLRQAIADSEAELAAICSALGERPLHTKQVDIMNCFTKCFLLEILILVSVYG